MVGRPKNRADSYGRAKINYKGGKPGRKAKSSFKYFRRWELLRLNKASASDALYIDKADIEQEILRRYELKEWCMNHGFKGRKYRKSHYCLVNSFFKDSLVENSF